MQQVTAIHILAYIVSLILLFLLGKLLLAPIDRLRKILINGILGGVFLILFNFIGQGFGVSLGVNLVTALTVGFLGIPGFLVLLILHFVL